MWSWNKMRTLLHLKEGIVSMLSKLFNYAYPHSHTCSSIFLYHYLSTNPYCFPIRLYQREQAFSVNKSIENTTTDFFKQSAAYFIEWRSARTKIILKKRSKNYLISSSVHVIKSQNPHMDTHIFKILFPQYPNPHII